MGNLRIIILFLENRTVNAEKNWYSTDQMLSNIFENIIAQWHLYSFQQSGKHYKAPFKTQFQIYRYILFDSRYI